MENKLIWQLNESYLTTCHFSQARQNQRREFHSTRARHENSFVGFNLWPPTAQKFKAFGADGRKIYRPKHVSKQLWGVYDIKALLMIGAIYDLIVLCCDQIWITWHNIQNNFCALIHSLRARETKAKLHNFAHLPILVKVISTFGEIHFAHVWMLHADCNRLPSIVSNQNWRGADCVHYNLKLSITSPSKS